MVIHRANLRDRTRWAFWAEFLCLSFGIKVKGRPMKRSKNVRKMKAIAKAISKSEKSVEKVMKKDGKTARTQSAKLLYD
ncbi:conserved hypothetical protein [Ricinus communis]|uniref:Uncharacterized protein n=1 Tax=Ricinus communis TaxID=3988 RepID=B9SID5_RICCO|nr:conserved hypothetical protein [Ricinus communis]